MLKQSLGDILIEILSKRKISISNTNNSSHMIGPDGEEYISSGLLYYRLDQEDIFISDGKKVYVTRNSKFKIDFDPYEISFLFNSALSGRGENPSFKLIQDTNGKWVKELIVDPIIIDEYSTYEDWYDYEFR